MPIGNAVCVVQNQLHSGLLNQSTPARFFATMNLSPSLPSQGDTCHHPHQSMPKNFAVYTLFRELKGLIITARCYQVLSAKFKASMFSQPRHLLRLRFPATVCSGTCRSSQVSCLSPDLILTGHKLCLFLHCALTELSRPKAET